MLEVLDQKKFFTIRSSLTSVDPATSIWLPGWCRTIESECIDGEEIFLMTVGSRFPAVPTH
jgi:hypothetical protein